MRKRKKMKDNDLMFVMSIKMTIAAVGEIGIIEVKNYVNSMFYKITKLIKNLI